MLLGSVTGIGLVFCAAGLASGQTVTQGDPKIINPIINPTAFVSPMVIETVFAPTVSSELWTKRNGTKPAAWKAGDWFTVADYHDLGKYTCDGISISNDYSRRHNKWEAGVLMRIRRPDPVTTEVGIAVTVTSFKYVHDKLATLFFEVVDGNTRLATTSVTVKVKEGGDSAEEGKLVVPTSVLKATPSPTLRITMTTKDY